jgi:hypothetical protein
MLVTNQLTDSPLAAAANELRDIKPPVVITSAWEWLWWALAIVVLIGVIALAARFWRKRREQPVIVPVIPPHERARRKLEAALSLFDQPKPFCTLVSDAVRLYLEERFELPVSDRTTEEFLGELKDSKILDRLQKDSLEQFLAACDLVKFARYEPGREELEGLYKSALRLIEETEPSQPTEGVHASRITHHETAENR